MRAVSALTGSGGDLLDVEFDELLSSPAQFPLQVSLADDALTFIQVRRLDYRHASFLDPRDMPRDALMWQTSLAALHDALPPSLPRQRLAYLFHTGFCCSTLLSRCAESSPEVFVLREPMSLHNLEAQLSGIGRDFSREKWSRALTTLMALLGRTWSARQIAMIKADCTLLVPTLLRHCPAPCVVLHCPVQDFLAAVMSCHTRRAWAIGRLRQMIEIARAAGMLVPFEIPAQLNAAQAATLIWWWQMSIFREARRIQGVGNCFLAANSFLDEPVSSLRALFDSIGVAHPGAALATLTGRVMARDAKNQKQRLNPGARRRKLSDTALSYAEPIDNALQWATQWIGQDFQTIGADFPASFHHSAGQ